MDTSEFQYKVCKLRESAGLGVEKFKYPEMIAKLTEEIGEASAAICFGKGSPKEEIGDVLAVLAQITEKAGLSLEEIMREQIYKIERKYGVRIDEI